MENDFPQGTLHLRDVVSALSVALDLTEGQPMGHSIRSCILGMRIAAEMQLPPQDCSDLYYALLLKDSGCSTNSARLHSIMGSDDIQAKAEVKFEDWTKVSLSGLRYLLRNVLPEAPFPTRLLRIAKVAIRLRRNNAELIGTRCERGAEIARTIGLSEKTAEAIRSLDEHWDGGGYPESRTKDEIPLLSRIMNVSQTLDVFALRSGSRAAIKAVEQRSEQWFDPEIVRVVRGFERDAELWRVVQGPKARDQVMLMEPGAGLPASPERIDSVCQAFAQIIDAKSPFTFSHSLGVADASIAIAYELGLSKTTVTMIRRAALLHDLGKLSVSNAILEKPGKLTPSEWEIVRKHPAYTRTILGNIRGFEELANVAGAHHEKLDGTGYPDGIDRSRLPLTARIIAVADVFQALTEKRPYRDNLPLELVFEIIDRDTPVRLDRDCVAALKKRVGSGSLEESKAIGMSSR